MRILFELTVQLYEVTNLHLMFVNNCIIGTPFLDIAESGQMHTSHEIHGCCM